MSKPLIFQLTFPILLIWAAGCQSPGDHRDPSSKDVTLDWQLGPFEKLNDHNPCLEPSQLTTFYCPVREDSVMWESKDVFNPAAVYADGKIHMIYRAEDLAGRYNGTSRLGMAMSTDGYTFEKVSKPVFYPARDLMMRYEWEGGIEDPRIVQSDDGRYIMTYTAYDGQIARLCTASSSNLRQWTKHGLAFQEGYSGRYKDLWSKSGAIVTRVEGEHFVASKIAGRYWMYWGDKHLHLATSDDLIRWTPVEKAGELLQVMSPRPGFFDSDLVEPGPPAIITDRGILLIYNARNYGPKRNTAIPEGTYSAGQVLFDVADPARILSRTDEPFFRPTEDYEISGQVNRVVFLEGLAPLGEYWYLYYGTADSKIAVARTPRN